MKKVTFGTRPGNVSSQDVSADAWVEDRVQKERMKRLTIDIPESLHRTIKAKCAMRGTKIADEVREMLLQKYGNH